MIDIHNHILPDVDDGALDMDESLEMAQIAEQDGIRHIIATPHLQESGLTLADIESKTAELNQNLQAAGIGVQVYPGAEIPLYLLDKEHYLIGLAGSRHLLVEFPLTGMLPISSEIFNYLTRHGYKIIIAHPERDPVVMRNPDGLLNLLSPDVTLQITADSLIGNMGRDVMSLARYLLRKKAVTYIASDAHDVLGRRPELSHGLKTAGKYLKQQAHDLVDRNPERILSGG